MVSIDGILLGNKDGSMLGLFDSISDGVALGIILGTNDGNWLGT